MRKTAPCPKDIEEEFRLSHPTVSGLLARLEKKGFIEMRSDREDRRCKRIYLLDKGKDCNKSMYETICATENRLVEGFTEEEKEQFFGYLNRAIANMGCSSCNPKHKEETQA
jgi:DNA-binding MarR family transcriptional regulator